MIYPNEQIKLAESLGAEWIDSIDFNGNQARTLECCEGLKAKFIKLTRVDRNLPHFQITPLVEVIQQLKMEKEYLQNQIIT